MPARKQDNVINQYVIVAESVRADSKERRRIRKRARGGGNAI